MAAPAAKTAQEALSPFRQGLKEVYLFSIVLRRSPALAPQYASFTVPLWFNKLDLRDYLHNVYNVRILNVRSYIKLQRLTQGKPSSLRGEDYPRPQYKRWHRPRSVKRMTVELERPFVWPEPPSKPEDFEPFNREQRKMADVEQNEYQSRQGPAGKTKIDEERRKSMREQAQALLEGRAKWKPVSERGSGYFSQR